MARAEQRNAYKGRPERPWIRVRLRKRDGGFLEVSLVADTGNPFPLIISSANLALVKVIGAPTVTTNFGIMRGGLITLAMPDFRLAQQVVGYASDMVCEITKSSHPDFDGLAGLPLLRMAKFGGDADEFWLKKQ